ANNLVSNDTSTSQDVFVRDLDLLTTTCASLDIHGNPGANAYYPSISDDATRVSFCAQSSQLVAYDANGTFDVFVRDLAQQTTVCASVDCSGAPGHGAAGYPTASSLSSDGRFVAFQTAEDDLVDDDTNRLDDAFVNDLANSGFQASWTNYGAGW